MSGWAVLLVSAAFASSTPPPANDASAAEPAADRTVDAAERSSLGLILLAPDGRLLLAASRSNIIRIVDETLREETSLRVLHYEESIVAQQCPEGRFSCFLEHVARTDYGPVRSNSASFEELRPALRAKPEQYPRLLLVLSLVEKADGSHRVAAVLIDCESALAAIHEARGATLSSGEPSTDELEDRIVRTAVRAGTPAANVAGGEIETFLRRFLEQTARAAFEETGTYAPYGSIALAYSHAGAVIEVDGRAVGETGARATRIEHVLPGVRELRVLDAGPTLYAARVTVERGRTCEAKPELVRIPDPLGPNLRTGLFYGGLAAAAIGAGVTAYALVRASSPDRIYACAGAEPCGHGPFLSSSPGGPADSLLENPDGSGVLLAPLGLSLIGGGATWALASALRRDEEALPLLELASGTVVLVSTYLLAAALGGSAR